MIVQIETINSDSAMTLDLSYEQNKTCSTSKRTVNLRTILFAAFGLQREKLHYTAIERNKTSVEKTFTNVVSSLSSWDDWCFYLRFTLCLEHRMPTIRRWRKTSVEIRVVINNVNSSRLHLSWSWHGGWAILDTFSNATILLHNSRYENVEQHVNRPVVMATYKHIMAQHTCMA